MRILTLLISATLLAGFSVVTVEGADSDAKTKALWRKHCSSCHGKDGKGKTRAGRRAGVEDMTEAAYQEKLKVKEAFKKIKEGFEEDGKEKMKAFESKLKDEEIKTLLKYVRRFNKDKK